MERETKICQSCKVSFTIDAEDFAFYEKIDVPPPTKCFECRMQRRMLWRNERILHRRKSDSSGKDIISQYPAETTFPVYGIKEFYARKWTPPYLDYNSERGFFEQFRELQLKTPRRALLTDLQSFENESIYQNTSSRNKRCYLVFATGDSEDCLYGHDIDRCKNVVDSLWVRKTEYAYECIDVIRCNRLFFSRECSDCMDSWFLYNCRNCTNCFGCAGLKNKSYCLWNKQLSKKDYEIQVDKILKTLTHEKITELSSGLEKGKNNYPVKFAHLDSMSSPTCTGDYIVNSKNVKLGFTVYDSQNSRYVAKLINSKECWDVSDWGDPAELCYESITIGAGAYRVFFSSDCWPNCQELQYCDSCADSNHLFGCVGLKNASYCVLNKQYSKKDYELLVSDIVKDMKNKGEYGEFFPANISPFSYNDTMAQDHFPLSKKQILEKGYRWTEAEERSYKATKKAGELPDLIGDLDDDNILKEVITCEHESRCEDGCSTAFKVILEELKFYRRFGIPLPRLCSNCRHTARFKKRNPLKLWHGRCQCNGQIIYKNTAKHFHGSENCPNEFETSYEPGRPEIVYCESCYNNEMT